LQLHTDISGRPIGLIFKVKAVHEEDLKMGLIGSPETSVRNCHSVSLKISKEHRSHEI